MLFLFHRRWCVIFILIFTLADCGPVTPVTSNQTLSPYLQQKLSELLNKITSSISSIKNVLGIEKSHNNETDIVKVTNDTFSYINYDDFEMGESSEDIESVDVTLLQSTTLKYDSDIVATTYRNQESQSSTIDFSIPATDDTLFTEIVTHIETESPEIKFNMHSRIHDTDYETGDHIEGSGAEPDLSYFSDKFNISEEFNSRIEIAKEIEKEFEGSGLFDNGDNLKIEEIEDLSSTEHNLLQNEGSGAEELHQNEDGSGTIQDFMSVRLSNTDDLTETVVTDDEIFKSEEIDESKDSSTISSIETETHVDSNYEEEEGKSESYDSFYESLFSDEVAVPVHDLADNFKSEAAFAPPKHDFINEGSGAEELHENEEDSSVIIEDFSDTEQINVDDILLAKIFNTDITHSKNNLRISEVEDVFPSTKDSSDFSTVTTVSNTETNNIDITTEVLSTVSSTEGNSLEEKLGDEIDWYQTTMTEVVRIE
jgi:hypothetical protein